MAILGLPAAAVIDVHSIVAGAALAVSSPALARQVPRHAVALADDLARGGDLVAEGRPSLLPSKGSKPPRREDYAGKVPLGTPVVAGLAIIAIFFGAVAGPSESAVAGLSGPALA